MQAVIGSHLPPPPPLSHGGGGVIPCKSLLLLVLKVHDCRRRNLPKFSDLANGTEGRNSEDESERGEEEEEDSQNQEVATKPGFM